MVNVSILGLHVISSEDGGAQQQTSFQCRAGILEKNRVHDDEPVVC